MLGLPKPGMMDQATTFSYLFALFSLLVALVVLVVAVWRARGLPSLGIGAKAMRRLPLHRCPTLTNGMAVPYGHETGIIIPILAGGRTREPGTQPPRPSACALAFRVGDARSASERALRYKAQTFRGRVGPNELVIPAIRGLEGSLIYLVDRTGAAGSIYDVDFTAESAV